MLKRLGDRGILILALSPAAIFILIAFIVIVGPRLAANLSATAQATGNTPATSTVVPTASATASAQPSTPTPEWIIIRSERSSG